MKTLLLTLFTACFYLPFIQAQTFEGYIKYSYTINLSPEQKAQMEKAQAQMNSPEMQAQMEMMKAKMNDPEFKKMMESNPQLKAQMEAMMHMSQHNMMDQMMPKEATAHFKNGNTLYQVNGGSSALAGDILYLKDKDQTYHIYKDRKAYRVVKKGNEKKPSSTTTVTKTNETQNILGHTCTKYIVKDSLLTMYVWATPELKDLYNDLKKISVSKDKTFFIDQIDGIPLKIESQTHGSNFTMQVVEIKKQPENAADFIIPAGYKEEK